MRIGKSVFAAAAVAILGTSVRSEAAQLPVGEPSFEAPVLDPGVQGWPFAAVPFGGPGVAAYPNYPWVSVVLDAGLFYNPAPPTPGGQPTGYLDNMDGRQATFIGGEFGNEFFQVVPADYEAGNFYTLRLGVAKSLFSAPKPDPISGDPSSIRAELHYLDDLGVRHLLAGRNVVDDAATGLRNDHFGYFDISTPFLAAGHPAVGQPVVIVVSMAGTGGGHFDVDDFSVTSAVPEPASVGLLALSALALIRRRR